MSLPTLPVHTNSMKRGRYIMILAIQVGLVTRRAVPPGSVKRAGTVYLSSTAGRMSTIILIISGKWLIALMRKRVFSVSWTLN